MESAVAKAREFTDGGMSKNEAAKNAAKLTGIKRATYIKSDGGIIMEYWYLWLLLIVLCVITVFVLSKASAAAKKHNDERDALFERI